MRRRSNLLVLLGLASFVLGLLAVYLVTSDDDDGSGGGGGDQVQVLVAGEALQAGALGEDIIRDERYRIETVDASERPADALVAPSQLSSTVLTLSFAEGEPLRTGGLRAVGGPQAQVPEGFEAVAVTVDFVAGGANTVLPGDRVNVFLVVPGELRTTAVTEAGEEIAAPPPFGSPRVELLLTNTLVLDVQRGTSPLSVSQPQEPGQATTATAETGQGFVVVLAVDTLDAEKVIFGTSAEGAELYFSRVRTDDDGNPAPPVESTPGVDFGTILAEEAGAAFRRSNG